MPLPELPTLPSLLAVAATQGTGGKQGPGLPAQVPGIPAQTATAPAEPAKRELPPIFGLPGMIPLIPDNEIVNPQLGQLKTIFDNAKVPNDIWEQRIAPALNMQTLLNEQTRTALNERITAYNEARLNAADTQALVDKESKKPLDVRAGVIAMNQIAADFAQRMDPSRNYLAMGKSREDLYIAQAKEKRLETLRGLEQNAQRAYDYAARMGDQIEMAKASRQLANAQSQINTVSSTMSQWFTAQDEAAAAAAKLKGEFEKIRLRVALETQAKAREGAGKLSDTQEKQLAALDKKYNSDTQFVIQRMSSIESNMTMDGEERAAAVRDIQDQYGRIKAKYDADVSAILGQPSPSIEQPRTADTNATKLLARRFMVVGKDNNQRIADIKSELANPESELWNDYRQIVGDDTVDTTSPALRRNLLQSLSSELRTLTTQAEPLVRDIKDLTIRLQKLEQRKADLEWRQETTSPLYWGVQIDIAGVLMRRNSFIARLKELGLTADGLADPDYDPTDGYDAEAEDAD
jgi:hypothetical protein